MIPGDGADRALDQGQIQTSVAAWQNWFQGQTGKRFRVDTFQGNIDVTFRKSGYQDASAAAFGSVLYYWLEEDLIKAGLADSSKWYVIYYDGGNSSVCGSAARPPEVGGHVSVVYLRGAGCPGTLAASASSPGYTEMAMLHEVVHSLGYVPSCAPRHLHDGHVPEANDLMYHGGGTWAPSAVDVNHDDYFGHNNPNCADLAKSALLEGGTQLPPVGSRVIDGEGE